MASQDTSFIPDMPPGPLDKYRCRVSFDWKKLKLIFEDKDMLQLKMKVWETLLSDHIFHHLPVTPSSEEQKRRAALQLAKFHQFGFYSNEIMNNKYKKKTRCMMTINEATAALHMDLSVKFALGIALCTNTVLSLGTERHLPFYKATWTGEILSCLALTEVAHGSNTKKMRTTATYDPKTQEFIIHTPDFLAAKCWVGNLGKTCTYAILFAQLITADGECHGLHAFVVPIRDPKTLLPYTGIIVGDMGEKLGLNGIDNGFMMFQNYRIPRESLLNKMSDVTPEGEYETCFTNPQQQLGNELDQAFSIFINLEYLVYLSAALENLSTGRVGIIQESSNTLSHAVCIAVRYSAVRKQFGPNDNDDEELAIIEYQLQSGMVAEIHAMVSACKPLITWTCSSAIQECREACGGNGYLKASGLGDLRNNHDAKVTYEGDNNVLVQQASNWLLRQWRSVNDSENKKEISSPLQTVDFLINAGDILQKKFRGRVKEDVMSHNFVKEAFQWMLCWLLRSTEEKYQANLLATNNKFHAKNSVQVYLARTLSLVYAQNNVLVYFWKRCSENSLESSLKSVLEKLYLLYGLWCLDQNLTVLYQGGYACGPELSNLVKDGVLYLCSALKDEAIGVVDALAPPDYILNSVLGTADGKVYDNLQAAFFHNPRGMERPSWWNEIVPKISSKL
ncbi:Probable peroxisomal acyl-coenzyme A oxidase 1 [Gryllus bimaculatus]|nr:Probable peroxisomal acyl-coenzyme A oxidase 1 [Gryllus bimaculatus]